MSSDRYPLRTTLRTALVVAALGPCSLHAQVTTAITPDNSLPTASTVTRNGDLYDIGGGFIRGSNQFHSFERLTVGTGDTASFSGPTGIQNILSRVTGSSPSAIDGRLRSTIPGADLYLLNPNGILFGPNASLELQGSFHATTASRIELTDGSLFNAVPSAADTRLTTAAPAAFGFLDPPAAIDVMSPDPFSPLQVPEGETLSFVGGELTLGAADGTAPAYVLAPDGTVNLVGITSGSAHFSGTRIDTSAASLLGDIQLRGGSVVDGKNVYIRGGRFTADNAAVIPGAFSLLGLAPSPNGGEVDLQADGDVTFTGTTLDPLIGAPAGIFAFAGNFTAFPTETAKVPDIRISADTVRLSGVAGVLTNRAGPGLPADIALEANSITIENGASISLVNLFEGPGDSLAINAGEVDLVGNGGASFTGIQTQAFFHTFFGGSVEPSLTFAESGSITISTTTGLNVRGGAQITTDSRSFGGSGDITINGGDIVLSDRGGVISAQSGFAGDSGNVRLNAEGGSVTIDNGFVVSINTFGSGDSGGLNLSASESVTISGLASGLASQTAPPSTNELNAFAQIFFGAGATFGDLAVALGLSADADLFAVIEALNEFGLTSVSDLTAGNGGSINVTAPVLEVSGTESAIDSGTAWDGDGGVVVANAGSVNIRDGGQIRSRSGLFEIGSDRLLVGNGNAGRVELRADGPGNISIVGQNSGISTTSLGDGNGGNVLVSAAGNLEVLQGGSITADSFGEGLTGNVSIAAGDSIRLDEGVISTSAATSDGGNIALQAPNMVRLTESELSTSVQSGVGGGGNILVDPEFVVLNESNVIANAFGGPGGNIRIIAGNFVPSADSVVEASSQLGVQGTIVIESPENDIAGQIAQLPQAYLDASQLLPERCAARRSAAVNSFVIEGRGGLPPNPDGYLPSFGDGVTGSPGDTAEAAAVSAPATADLGGRNTLLVWWDADCGEQSHD